MTESTTWYVGQEICVVTQGRKEPSRIKVEKIGRDYVYFTPKYMPRAYKSEFDNLKTGLRPDGSYSYLYYTDEGTYRNMMTCNNVWNKIQNYVSHSRNHKYTKDQLVAIAKALGMSDENFDGIIRISADGDSKSSK